MSRELFDAMTWVRVNQPYLALALAALVPVHAPGLDTLAVDHLWRLYWDQKALLRWGKEGSGAVLVHEIQHLIRLHSHRREERDPKEWNIASDLEINWDLDAQGLPLPKEGVRPSQRGWPDRLLAEQYYNLILQAGQGGQGKAGDKSGKTPGGPGQHGQPGHQHGPTCGGGSGVDGVARDYELAPDAAPGIDEQTAKAIQRDTARAVRDAIARGQGNISDGMQDWAAGVLRPPKVPWQSVLRQVLGRATAKAGKQDYSYRRPHRRQSLTPDFIRPGQISYPVNVGLVVDVSGSMGDQGPRVLAEVKALANAASAGNVKAWAVNTGATVQKDLKKWQQGGGTDMRPGIAAAVKAKVDVVIVITDGGTPWPAAPIGKPMIVVLVGDHKMNTVPDWARVIEVEG